MELGVPRAWALAAIALAGSVACNFDFALDRCQRQGRCQSVDGLGGGAYGSGGNTGLGGATGGFGGGTPGSGGGGDGGSNGPDGSVALTLAFAPAQLIAVGTNPMCLAVGDVDRDGRLDVLTANEVGGTVTVLLGVPDGGLTKHGDVSVGTVAGCVALAYLDGPGDVWLDMIVASGWEAAGALVVLTGSGDGGFSAPRGFGSSAIVGVRLALAQLDADGWLDAITAGWDYHAVTVHRGGAGGVFTQSGAFQVEGPSGLAIADFDGDGDLDFAVGSESTTAGVQLFSGKGDGTFSASSQYFSGPLQWHMMAPADIDGDGFVDLAVADGPPGRLAFLQGKSDGGLEVGLNALNLPADGVDVVAADLNLDGRVDLAVLMQDGSDDALPGSLLLLQGRGDGTFVPRGVLLTGGGEPFNLGLGDFDRDGLVDLVSTNYKTGNVSLFMNRSIPQ
jgi:large repetitive protein